MKKFILPLFLCAGIFVSCNQDLLEIPQKGVNDYDSFYKTEEDAESALVTVYANFASNIAAGSGIYNAELMLLNYSADDVYAAGGHKDDHDGFRFFNEFNYDPSYGVIKELYGKYYYAIYPCNLLIDNYTKEGAPKSANIDRYIAEARVMRAYLHMQLAIIWGNPPIIDHVLVGSDLPSSSPDQKTVLDWVVAEIDAAMPYLEERNGPSDKKGAVKITKGFAQFVAGKASMFNNDPASARKYLKALIDSGNYALVPGERWAENHHKEGNGNEEKIFESNFVNSASISDFWGKVGRTRWMVANTLNWRGDALATLPKTCAVSGWNGGAMQQDFAKKFLEHDGDSYRRKGTFFTEEEFLYEQGWKSDDNGYVDLDGNKVEAPLTLEQKKADPTRGIKTQLYARDVYFEIKHHAFPSDAAPDIMSGTSNLSNYKVARYAEALLLYAEACIGSSEEAEGLKALQAVQERSGSGKISPSLTLAAVQEEKQYELWFEGCRFPDVVRWGIADQVYNNGRLDKTPICRDEFFIEGTENYHKQHKFVVTYTDEIAKKSKPFEMDKHGHLPFPSAICAINPNLIQHDAWL